jgi:signal transduction histidine kinase
VVLLALSGLLSMVAIPEVLNIRLQSRIEDGLQQEVLELDRLLSGRDPETGLPFDSLERVFTVYFDRNVPGSEEGVIAFLEGEVFRADLDRYPISTIPPAVLAEWAAFSTEDLGDDVSTTDRFQTELGEAQYRAAPIRFGNDNGAFVVTVLPVAQAIEIRELQTYGVVATLGVVLVASVFAYLFLGRVLAPVRLLTIAARSISESDLTQRIEVYGSDEAAQMARSFNAMLDRLESVFASQREFVEDASHELRDPLTICRGYLELLPEDPGERKAAVTIVLDELDRMSRIVDDLRLLAEVEQPNFLRAEPVDLALLTHELVAKARPLASRAWRLEAMAEGVITADRQRLTEAVMNLAHNAAQHTTENDTIYIGSAHTDTEVRLWVKDTGPGISLGDQERIFKRFTRGRGAHRRYRGVGLGLAIVRAIATAHGGRVELDSRFGEGSTFTIVIPRGAEGAGNATGFDR